MLSSKQVERTGYSTSLRHSHMVYVIRGAVVSGLYTTSSCLKLVPDRERLLLL